MVLELLIDGFLGLIVGFGLGVAMTFVALIVAVCLPPSDGQATAQEAYSRQWYCRSAEIHSTWTLLILGTRR